MAQGIILIQGDNSKDAVDNVGGLSNAKHIVIGEAPGFGTILHINANSLEDFSNAMRKFAETPDVVLVTLAFRN